MKEKQFAQLQRRRAQTEGRISILKQGFLGQPMRAQGFAHRELALAWGVLTHNLWMLARMKQVQKKAQSEAVPLRKAAARLGVGLGYEQRLVERHDPRIIAFHAVHCAGAEADHEPQHPGVRVDIMTPDERVI